MSHEMHLHKIIGNLIFKTIHVFIYSTKRDNQLIAFISLKLLMK